MEFVPFGTRRYQFIGKQQIFVNGIWFSLFFFLTDTKNPPVIVGIQQFQGIAVYSFLIGHEPAPASGLHHSKVLFDSVPPGIGHSGKLAVWRSRFARLHVQTCSAGYWIIRHQSHAQSSNREAAECQINQRLRIVGVFQLFDLGFKIIGFFKIRKPAINSMSLIGCHEVKHSYL